MADCRHPPGQQAAFLPIGRQLGAEQLQHVLGRKLLDFVDRAAAGPLDQHRAAAWLMQQPSPSNQASSTCCRRVDRQLHADHVAAERVVVLVGVRGPRAMAAMKRLFVVLEDAILIDLVAGRHRL